MIPNLHAHRRRGVQAILFGGKWNSQRVSGQFASWTQAIHGNSGNVGLSDGSVQQYSHATLRDALRNSGDPAITRGFHCRNDFSFNLRLNFTLNSGAFSARIPVPFGF